MTEKQSDSVPLTEKQAEANINAPPMYTPHAQQQPTVMYAPAPMHMPVQNAPLVHGPPDYLVMSIFTILFCFWPLGVFALIKSMEVKSAVTRGDLASAETASRQALKLNKIAIAIGITLLVFSLLIGILAQLSWIIPLIANARDNI